MGLVVDSYRFAAAGGAFAPTDIAGCTLWTSADEITGKSDGDIVLTWNDQSGNTNDMTTATNGPTYKTSIINSLPILRFDGSNDLLETVAASIGPNYTLFLVAQYVTGAATGIIDSDQSPDRLFQYRWSGANIQFIGFNSVGGTGSDTQAVTRANAVVYTGVRDTGTVEAFIDGVSGGSTAVSGTNATKTNRVRVGQWQGGVSAYDLGEVVMYDSALGSTDRAAVEDYLATKWGI